MYKIVSESIAAQHGHVSAGDPSGPTAFPVILLIFLTELFQQLNRSRSLGRRLSLESFVEVIIFNILLTNAEP